MLKFKGLTTTDAYMNYPGKTLEKKLIEYDLSQSDLSKRTGITAKTINTIIKGSASISPDTAILLSNVLDVSAQEWLLLEAEYQLSKANATQLKLMKEDLDYLKKIDLAGIIKQGWVEKKNNNLDQLKEILNFFGVSSVKQISSVWSKLEVNYKTSEAFQKKPENIMLWLRGGEILGKKLPCNKYDAKKFKEALVECRELTRLSFDEVKTKIVSKCSKAGVAVVFTPELLKISTSGAAQWLSNDKALIQLSLRGKKDDLFWFSFFHEAAHILYHGRKGQFLDDGLKDRKFYSPERKVIEAEADDFSADILIPRQVLSEFINEQDFSEKAIEKFAKEINIASGIVVGQLQKREFLGWGSSLNKLKQTYKFS